MAMPACGFAAPNVVLIVADDLGFSDLGAYGSEIATPHLDRLAARGVRFTNLHVAASCAPTRAMLMTGVDSHAAGVANIREAIPSYQLGAPGYTGALRRDVPTLAEHLDEAGYRTYFAGKWHLGQDAGQLPIHRGFDRSVALGDTGADNWEQKPYAPLYARANWYENGEPTTLPDDFYSSDFIVDKTIEFIESDEESDQPFFAYVAFQAVHIPVQAPAQFRDKYVDAYVDGWHALRERRVDGLVQSGVLTERWPMSTPSTTRDWESLDAAEQSRYAMSMAVYAGMVEAMDAAIGRLVAHLERAGNLDDTVFLFLSDNGAEGSEVLGPASAMLDGAYFRAWMRTNGYGTDLARLGERGSYVEIGPSWASAAVGPLAWYKFYASEGGMRVPLILSGRIDGANVTPDAGGIARGFAWAPDIAATIVDLAGLAVPDSMSGRSLVPLVAGGVPRVYREDEVVGYELGGNRALFQGDYKIVYNRFDPPHDRWQLFNLRRDPGETRDLAERQPERLQEMIEAWDAWASQHAVLPVEKDYDQRRQASLYAFQERPVLWVGPLLVCVALLALAAFWFHRRARRPSRSN
jgi:arylsulfatase/uncharacterized sulfatase